MPTFQDIADIAGVSKATVSLALSNSPRISAQTKMKIRNIAREIGYELKSQETATDLWNESIGIVYISDYPSIEQSFFRDTLMGVTEEASRLNYDVKMIGIHLHDNTPAPANLAEKVLQSGVRGIIIITSLPVVPGLEQLLDMRFPLVFIGNRKASGITDPLFRVASDNYQSGRTAAAYLHQLGHRTLAFAMSKGNPPWEKERVNGFISQLRELDVPTEHAQRVEIDFPFAAEAPCWNVLEQAAPTAWVAANPRIGLTMLQYARHRGLSIPHDRSLIVFDDIASFAYESPPITVIEQNLKTLGTMSLKLLADLIANPSLAPSQLSLSTRLVERLSCAPPPQAK